MYDDIADGIFSAGRKKTGMEEHQLSVGQSAEIAKAASLAL